MTAADRLADAARGLVGAVNVAEIMPLEPTMDAAVEVLRALAEFDADAPRRDAEAAVVEAAEALILTRPRSSYFVLQAAVRRLLGEAVR